MKINVSNPKDVPVGFIALGEVEVLPPKKDFEGNPKFDENGNALFNARAFQAVRIIDGKPAGAEDSVSLSLREQPGVVKFGQTLFLSGNITVVHYVTNNNRLGVSITADRLISPKGDS